MVILLGSERGDGNLDDEKGEKVNKTQKEKDPLRHFGEFPCSNSSSLLSTQPLASPGTVRTSSLRELRIQAPPGAGCPATWSVPIHREVLTPHLGVN